MAKKRKTVKKTARKAKKTTRKTATKTKKTRRKKKSSCSVCSMQEAFHDM